MVDAMKSSESLTREPDLERIDAASDWLNEEAEEVLEYQTNNHPEKKH
jgi:hypothetical protein